MLPRRAFLVFNLALLLPGLALLAPRISSMPADRPLAPGLLRLSWDRQLPRLEPTWPDQPRFTSDAAPRPVVAGSVVLVTSSRHDALSAFDVRSGEVRWRFQTDGPVRFAPAVWNGRAYLSSDDGHLYCVDVRRGELLWKFRGGPSDRRLLGNGRSISAWPARGAPVVAPERDEQATVYFAAGIWPFMGIFLHALDAHTGEIRWQNSGEGAIFVKQPHQTDAFAGIAPQGNLVLAGDRLLVPGGRSIAACFDRHSGRRLHYRLADSSKLGGGPDILAAGEVYLNGGGAFDLEEGHFLGTVGEPAAVVDGMLYAITGTTCRAHDLTTRPEPPLARPDAKAKSKKKPASDAWLGDATASVKVPRTTTLLAAHGRLYGAGEGVVYALELPLRKNQPAVVWQAAFQGTAAHLAASAERLLVSTREGRLLAFDSRAASPRRHPLQPTPLPESGPDAVRQARQVLAATGVREGHAVVWGIGSGELIAELLRRTSLRLLVLDPDRDRVSEFRERLRQADLDGKRISVLPLEPLSANLPPYFANLVVCGDLAAAGIELDGRFLDQTFQTLRPYGGRACLAVPVGKRGVPRAWMEGKPGEGQARLEERDGLVVLHRDGPLPGAADWTHQHADASNTRVSRDGRVKAPLGVLWFGGPGNQGILPRHGHGPVPQVCEGRLFIEGPDRLRAIDVYTGRLLWERTFPGLGKAYDNVAHQPGANGIGSNYVSTPEGIFVAYQDSCLRLDPGTGKMLKRYRLPRLPRQKKAPEWTFVTIEGNYLVGGSGTVDVPVKNPTKKSKAAARPGVVSSKRLTVLDRRTGKVLWSIEAKTGFRHNAICLSGNRLFAIDIPMTEATAKTGKGKAEVEREGRLVAHDLETGKLLWRAEKEVFGTWLSYSRKHDVLVEAGLMSRDTLRDEPVGMRAYQGGKGTVLWYQKDYFGPALIHGERILKGGDASAASGTACDLLTGKPIRVPDPLTGQPLEWRWRRTYGCNTPAASEHLVLFRSGAAGFYDLCNDGGTGNLGGFRSSCTLNLIVAGGVLTVPDFTRTCTCSYQNQCSVGLIHLPENELWTFTGSRTLTGPIRQVGLNLGAPGSRRADNGTLWLEYPPAGGPSPKIAVATTPAKPDTFRLHPTSVKGEGPRWVASSGVRGLTRLTLTLGNDVGKPRPYTVRTYFLEPDGLSAGSRLFDVAIQGKPVLSRFDVSQEAGGPGRLVTREWKNILVGRDLTLTLTPSAGAPVGAPVLSGVEVLPGDG